MTNATGRKAHFSPVAAGATKGRRRDGHARRVVLFVSFGVIFARRDWAANPGANSADGLLGPHRLLVGGTVIRR
jgi:hypothetical protein